MSSSSVASAKAAISCLCDYLVGRGISSLDPESLRQAKFNGPVAGKLWRAVHDLVLIRLLSLQRLDDVDRLQQLWGTLVPPEEDHAESGEAALPPAGAAMLRHHLLCWGCPPGLVLPLGADAASVGSRPLLLILGWLVAHCRLFEAQLAELQPGPQLAALLPPHGEDTSGGGPSQRAYAAGVQQAHAAVSSALACASQHAGWAAVEAASQQALMLLGRVHASLSLLTALYDARHKLYAKLLAAQGLASGAPMSSMASPYDVHLMACPAALQEHRAALQAATQVEAQRLEVAQHAITFFQWMGSVLQEEQQQQQAAGRLASGLTSGSSEPGSLSGSGSVPVVWTRLPPDASGDGWRHPAVREDGPMLQQVAEGAAAVAAAGPKAMAACLQQMDDRLSAAAAQVGDWLQAPQPFKPPALSTAERLLAAYGAGKGKPGGGRSGLRGAASAAAASAAARGGLAAGEEAPELTLHDFSAAANAAAAASSAQPPSGGSAASSAAWQLPEDLAAGLEALRLHQARQSQLTEVGLARQQHTRPLLSHVLVPDPARDADPALGLVDAESEIHRLAGLALGVARELARVRAANKQALAAAMQAGLPADWRVVRG